MSYVLDSFADHAEGVAAEIAELVPNYHADAADINESLDTGWASCASRSYAVASVLRHDFPNPNIYQLSFGYAPEHGEEIVTKSGERALKMGHTVIGIFLPGERPLVIDSYSDATFEIKPNISDEYAGYSNIWDPSRDVSQTYYEYLVEAGMEDLEIRPDDILRQILSKIRPQDSSPIIARMLD